FTRLYRRRQGPLFRFALRMSGSSAVAEDVVQETFMVLLNDPARFDPVAGSLVGFLFGIVCNRVRRYLERRGADVPRPDGEEAPEGGVGDGQPADDPRRRRGAVAPAPQG